MFPAATPDALPCGPGQCPDLWKPVSYETDNEQSHRQVVIAAAIGAIVELVVFTISQVTARNLYIILGGLAGAALALVLQRYWLAVQLTEVKITIPQVSEMTFVVNNDARQVAWKLYVETATRVST